jgi:competence protein ComEC
MLRNFVIIWVIFSVFVLRYFVALDSLPNFSEEYGEGDWELCLISDGDLRESHVKYWAEDIRGRRLLLRAKKFTNFFRGDCLSVKGDLKPVPYIDNFDYSNYLQRYYVTAILEVYDLTLIHEGGGMLRYFDQLRIGLEMKLNELFVDPYGDFMAGLLLGRKRGLSSELMEKFNQLGLTHIIAVSGYNVSLMVIAAFSFAGFFRMGRRVKVIFAILLVFCFVVLVGASAAVVRAGIMGVIALFAAYFGRVYNFSRALLFVLIAVYFYNPFIVFYDVGFQLSFLSTCGVTYLYPKLESFGKYIPSFFAIRESFLMTIASQLAVLPIVYFQFGGFSWISPFANVLILPLIPFAMLAGFLALLFSLFSSFLSLLFAFLAYLVMDIVLLIVDAFSFFTSPGTI